MLLFCDLFSHYLMWVLQDESQSVGFPKMVLMCPSLVQSVLSVSPEPGECRGLVRRYSVIIWLLTGNNGASFRGSGRNEKMFCPERPELPFL